MKLLFAALALIASPAAAQNDAAETARTQNVDRAIQMIQNKQPAEALAVLDGVLDEYQALYANEKSTIFCAENTTEMLFYLGGAAAGAEQARAQGRSGNAIAIGHGWCLALWAKGFALIDQGKVAEAVPFLQHAVALAPAHSHYLSELAYAYQTLRRFDESLALYRQAETDATFANEGNQDFQRGRALRGIGFDLVELGRWDEAAEAYRKALKINPDDQAAKGELEYIAQNRPKH